MKRIRLGLNQRIAVIVLTLMLLMSAGVVWIGLRAIYNDYLNYYHKQTRLIVEVVADGTEWNKIEHFAETGDPDEYSEELARFFSNTKTSIGTPCYLGLILPHEDTFTCVLEGCAPWDDPANDIAPYGASASFDALAIDKERLRSELLMGLGNQDISFSQSTEGNVLVAWEPVFDENGTMRATVLLQLVMRNIEQSQKAFTLRVIRLSAIISVAAMALMLWFLRRNVTRPIKKLSVMVDSYENGSFAETQFRYKDEISGLADSFTAMTRRIEAYTGEVARATAEKERIGAEFDIAKQIQSDILPTDFPAFPERREFDIFATLEPSPNISGNFYDFFLVDDDHLAMVIGDTSDRGVPAALFMIMVKTLIKDRALQGFSPAEVIQSVSEQLLEGNRANMFATVWFAVLELSTGKGVAENAGHWHPVLRRAGNKFEMEKYHHSPPLASKEGVRYRDHGFRLEPGDTLLVYTGGVVETVNEKGELFGESHMLDALNRDPEATPSVLLQTLTSAVHRFSGDMPQSDDRTTLAIKYYGTSDEIREKL